jgi:DNA-binding response OmpR family regulator
MGRDPNAKPIQILHIGRVDPNHERLWQQLQGEGVVVAFARTQVAGLQMARELQPQIVVVNTTDSHFSGDRLCRTLGRRLPGTQRLLIVEQGASVNIPCEIRLVQPFTGRKLRESLLNLLEMVGPNIIRAGPLELDLVSQTVNGPKGPYHLTPKECNLLALLMRHPNQVISRKDLMARIWSTFYVGDTRTLDVHIHWLREKIELDFTRPTLLLTRRGVGYLLAVPAAASTLNDTPEEE